MATEMSFTSLVQHIGIHECATTSFIRLLAFSDASEAVFSTARGMPALCCK